jgi:hypothetical protein
MMKDIFIIWGEDNRLTARETTFRALLSTE